MVMKHNKATEMVEELEEQPEQPEEVVEPVDESFEKGLAHVTSIIKEHYVKPSINSVMVVYEGRTGKTVKTTEDNMKRKIIDLVGYHEECKGHYKNIIEWFVDEDIVCYEENREVVEEEVWKAQLGENFKTLFEDDQEYLYLRNFTTKCDFEICKRIDEEWPGIRIEEEYDEDDE
jgi:hypothetical protein